MPAEAAIDLGLYGTLLDPDLRVLVFGEAARHAARPAVLRDWEAVFLEGQNYPGLRFRPGVETRVKVLQQLPVSALAVADAYEGDEYRRRALPVTWPDHVQAEGTATFYLPVPTVRLSGRPWRYDESWRVRHLAACLEDARDAGERVGGGQ
jgi:hypothetical protein